MLSLYENEIKKRWDQRAQIKNKFIFPRTFHHHED